MLSNIILISVFTFLTNICFSQDVKPNELSERSNEIDLIKNMDLFVSSLNYYNDNFGSSKKQLQIEDIQRNRDEISIFIICGRNNYKSTIATCSYFLGQIFRSLGNFDCKSIKIILQINTNIPTKYIANISLNTLIKITNKEIEMSDFINNLNLIKERGN